MKQEFTTHRKLAVAAMLAALALVAWAANPHFLSATASLQADGDADVCFRETGLGDNQNINYLASATASATYHCVNNGGKCPNAANKTATSGLVSTPATISSGKNGSIRACLTLSPPPAQPGDLTCPGGQHVAVTDVTYSDIKIADQTNNVVQSTTPSSLSATLTVCE